MQTSSLRPYQIEGVKKIIELGRDVLLADEPGLGKTIQVAEVINRTHPASVRVVCPASLRLNWARELEVWLTFRPAAVEIMSYEAVVSAKDTLAEVDLLVFDEAHYLKNPDAKRTKKCLVLTAKKRLFLTGTPVVNRPMDLYPMLNAMGLAVSRVDYGKRYCDGFLQVVKWNPRTHKPMRTVWNFSGASNVEELSALLKSRCMVRRTKAEVLSELPAKTRQVVELDIPLSTTPEAVRTAVYPDLASADAAGVSPDVAFQDLSAVRLETALHKLPHVVAYIQDLLEEEEKLVVFAWHREVIDALAASLPRAVKLYGGMSDRAKDQAVQDFQAGDARVFVGQITAAGTGLTLTAADTAVFAEIDWVPGNITQAEDRLHRIGQSNPVRIIHLVQAGSVDCRMVRALVAKQEVIDAVNDDVVPSPPVAGAENKQPEPKEKIMSLEATLERVAVALEQALEMKKEMVAHAQWCRQRAEAEPAEQAQWCRQRAEAEPAEQAPAEQAPAEQAPAEQAPAEQAPAELDRDALLAECKALNIPVPTGTRTTTLVKLIAAAKAAAPAEQAPAEQAPAEQAPAVPEKPLSAVEARAILTKEYNGTEADVECLRNALKTLGVTRFAEVPEGKHAQLVATYRRMRAEG
jgi:SWI/SNF-related matrix-associated actin-dependent regulator 1 of chromatin subfamily A